MFVRIWDERSIEEHILARDGIEPLNSHYYATTYPRVYAAAERLFGSWGDAIEACGFDYNLIRKYRVWNKKSVITEIKKMQEQGAKLTSSNAQRNFKIVYMAAIHHYRSWGNAIHSAGLDYKKIRLRRSMSKEAIRQEILDLYQKGVDLSYCNIRKNYQYLLACGSKKLGEGSWAKARKVCGIHKNFRSQKKQESTQVFA
ncbi:MAG: hypothetical protein WCS73_05190 [Lentisphaeria bacterium]